MSRAAKSRGFGATLNEVVLATAIFSTVIVCVFGVFHLGNENWRIMTVRHSLQNDGKKAMFSLRIDLESTHFTSVSFLNRGGQADLGRPGSPNWVSVERDAICLAALRGLKGRNDPNNFTTGGQLKWNRYVVYYVTKDPAPSEPDPRYLTGKLIKEIVVDTDATAIGPFAYGKFPGGDPGAWLANDPKNNPGSGTGKVESVQILANDVLHFSVNGDPASKVVQATLKLRKQGKVWGKGNEYTAETFQLDLKVRPENSSMF